MTRQADWHEGTSVAAILLAMVLVAALMGLRAAAETTLSGLAIKPPAGPTLAPAYTPTGVLVRPAGGAPPKPLPSAEPVRARPIPGGLPKSVVPTTIASVPEPPLATFASAPQKTALKSAKARTDLKAKGLGGATPSVSPGQARRAEHAEQRKSSATEGKARK